MTFNNNLINANEKSDIPWCTSFKEGAAENLQQLSFSDLYDSALSYNLSLAIKRGLHIVDDTNHEKIRFEHWYIYDDYDGAYGSFKFIKSSENDQEVLVIILSSFSDFQGVFKIDKPTLFIFDDECEFTYNLENIIWFLDFEEDTYIEDFKKAMLKYISLEEFNIFSELDDELLKEMKDELSSRTTEIYYK